MFQQLDAPPDDPILGLLAAFRTDPSADKVDLGVGIYKDERGRTPVLEAVRAAEQWLIAEQESKAYLGPAGNEKFNAAIANLVLGADHPAIRDGRVRVIQSPGGCGALRLGAELIVKAHASTTLHASDPTWANHVPLLSGAGLQLERYPYYDTSASKLQFDAMLGALSALPAGDVVLLHGSCHNPTGADLSAEQWQSLNRVVGERRLMPFVDIAYQGLGDGLDPDAQGARLFADKLPEMLIAVSCSKNFGLYRERVGALVIVGETRKHADAAAANVCRIARGLYSMPPDHGAAVVARILEEPSLSALWRQELAKMRGRIADLRHALSEALSLLCPSRDFSYIAHQRGMFSLLNLPSGAVDRLRKDKHIYMTADGRINVCGLREQSVDYVASSVSREINPR